MPSLRSKPLLALLALLVAIALSIRSTQEDGTGAAPTSPKNGPAAASAPRGHAVPVAGSASATHHRAAVADPSRDANARASGPLRARPTGTLIVYVRAGGGTVCGSVVHVDGQHQTTDQLGIATFQMPAGRTFVRVRAPEGSDLRDRSGWQTVPANRETTVTVELELRPRTVFWCRLLAAEDGRPIVGTDVRILPADTLVQSDRHGYVQIALPDTRTWLDIRVPGRAPCRVVAGTGHPSRGAAMQVRLRIGSELEMLVTDDAGAAVADVQLVLMAAPWHIQIPTGRRAHGAPVEFTATTGITGRLTISDLPPGIGLTARVRAPSGYASIRDHSMLLREPRERRTLVLATGGVVTGQVIDQMGQPIAGVRVQANPADRAPTPRVLPPATREHCSESAPDGFFRIGGLGEGQWWIGVHATDGRHAKVAVVTLRRAGHAKADLVIMPGLPVSGGVLTTTAEAVHGVVIDLVVDGQPIKEALTDSDGRFRFDDVPAGPCELRTRAFEANLGLPAPLMVEAGAEGIELQLVARFGAVAGKVVGGRSPWVSARRRGTTDAIAARVDLDGSFRYPGLRAGIWDLKAIDGPSQVAWLPGVVVTRGADTADLRLDLRQGATLRPVHPDADAFLLLRGGLPGGGDALQPGVAGRAVVPPGQWTVVFRRQGRETARRTITIEAGEDRFVRGDG